MTLKPVKSVKPKEKKTGSENYDEKAVKSMVVKSVSPILIPTQLYGEITRKKLKATERH